jgi:hypothetical protein
MNYEIHALLRGLQDVLTAKRDRDEEKARYIGAGGYEWGYVGHTYEENLRETLELFGERLNAVIDARVEEKLKEYDIAKFVR